MARKNRFDELMEAIAFAEVGELDTASDVAARAFQEEPAPQAERILAVSRAGGFSRRMIEHAVGMAARLGYGLVALSVQSRVTRVATVLRGAGGERGGWLPAEAFRQRAEARGVPFVHAVGRGDPEKAVAAVTRRFRRIAFLLVEGGHAPRSRFAAIPVPVFYLEER